MEIEKIRKAYSAANELIGLLTSSYGDKIRKEHPELVVLAENTLIKYQPIIKEFKLNDEKDEIVLKMLEDLDESKQTLKFIEESDRESLKLINDIIEKTSKELQNQITYDPLTFFNNYGFAMVAPMIENVVNPSEIVKNERFVQWFANSRCIDEKGLPRIVYHGTGYDEFDSFSFDKFPGSYFAENKSYSVWFSKNTGKGNGKIFKVFLRITKPMDLTDFKVDKVEYEEFVEYIKVKYGYTLPPSKNLKAASKHNNGLWAWQYLRMGVDWLRFIKNNSDFDGIHYYENNPSDVDINGNEAITPAWLVFNKEQIKTADERNFLFSLNSKIITMRNGGMVC